MKFKEHLIKLQNLPDKKKKIILWTIVAIVAFVMLIFWVRVSAERISKFNPPKIDFGAFKVPSNINIAK
jgi:hypothetical protein